MATIEVPAEDLIGRTDRLPRAGRRLRRDPAATTAHTPARIATRRSRGPGGRATCILDDYRFHAQNVYALVMKTLARFEFALGRRVGWSFDSAPAQGRAARRWWTPTRSTRPDDRGAGVRVLPGARRARRVYTCLSHDVVVHETTHALLDALRERYMMPSSPDQAAFHEGFADVVALLSVFSQPELVEAAALRPRRRAGERRAARSRRASDAPRRSAERAVRARRARWAQEIQGARGERPAPQRRDRARDPTCSSGPEFQRAAPPRGGLRGGGDERLRRGVVGRRRRRKRRRLGQRPTTVPLRASRRKGPTSPTRWPRCGSAPSTTCRRSTAVRRRALRGADRRHGGSPRRLALRAARRTCWTRSRPTASRPASDRGTIRRHAGSAARRAAALRSRPLRVDAERPRRGVPLPLGEPRGARTRATRRTPRCCRCDPACASAIDGFVLRETVAEYYQVARLTPGGAGAAEDQRPADYVAQPLQARARAKTRRRGRRRRRTRADAGPSEANVTDEDAKTGHAALRRRRPDLRRVRARSSTTSTTTSSAAGRRSACSISGARAFSSQADGRSAGARRGCPRLHRLRAIDARTLPRRRMVAMAKHADVGRDPSLPGRLRRLLPAVVRLRRQRQAPRAHRLRHHRAADGAGKPSVAHARRSRRTIRGRRAARAALTPSSPRIATRTTSAGSRTDARNGSSGEIIAALQARSSSCSPGPRIRTRATDADARRPARLEAHAPGLRGRLAAMHDGRRGGRSRAAAAAGMQPVATAKRAAVPRRGQHQEPVRGRQSHRHGQGRRDGRVGPPRLDVGSRSAAARRQGARARAPPTHADREDQARSARATRIEFWQLRRRRRRRCRPLAHAVDRSAQGRQAPAPLPAEARWFRDRLRR